MRGRKPGRYTGLGWWNTLQQAGEGLKHVLLHLGAKHRCSGSCRHCTNIIDPIDLFVSQLFPWLCCIVNPPGRASSNPIFHSQAVTELCSFWGKWGWGGVGSGRGMLGRCVKKKKIFINAYLVLACAHVD